MLTNFYGWLPQDGVKIVLVLLLSFLIGLEREERKAAAPRYNFGGVRTFPLIGLIGYSLALLSKGQPLLVALGFLAIAGFLWLSYWHKLTSAEAAGITTEMSALATYLLGALVYYGDFWIATTLGVACVLLLDLKAGLESLTQRFPPEEILTFTKFLLLTAVILPVLPNKDFTAFHLNPFKTWLVVVAVSAISYASYALQKMTKARGGVILAALLGGAYSSTAATVVLARRAKQEGHPHLFSGGILVASGVTFIRIVILVAFFSWSLTLALALPYIVLTVLGISVGWWWSRRSDVEPGKVAREFEPENPLELRAALLFALLFVVILSLSHLAAAHLGKGGVYALGALTGVTDITPFIMGMTQALGTLITIRVAAAGIVIATASNNVVKALYAYSLADRRTGLQSLAFLMGLAVLGLVPLVWLMG
ncbi:MAG TPA: MgtC/SapB family protein [Terriglobia bacterium]|nr:MgtC/SapB family protein [Terriglobia bacterium]